MVLRYILQRSDEKNIKKLFPNYIFCVIIIFTKIKGYSKRRGITWQTYW